MTPNKVSFGDLFRRGLVKPGDLLSWEGGYPVAEVMPQGKLSCNGYVSNMHAVAGEVSGNHPCNGWEHWQYKDPETREWKPISELRERYRKIREVDRSILSLPGMEAQR